MIVPSIADDHPAFQDDATFHGLYETRIVDVDGISIQFSDWASPNRRVLVLVHGFNVQGHTWDPIARALQPYFRILCPDLRGHGGSAWSRDGYWTRDFARDLAGLLDREGLEACDVVGHSLGARVGIALAAQHKRFVRSLVLSDAGPELLRAGAQQSTNIGAARLARRGFNTYAEALALYQEVHPEWRPVFHRLHAQFQLRRNWAGKLIECADPDLYWITRSAGQSENPEIWDFARQVQAPTLLLWSEEAGFLDEAMVARYSSAFSDFQAISSTAGHYIPRERPGEFCRAILTFLGEQVRIS